MLVQAVAAFAMSSAQVIGEPTEKLTVEIVHHGDDSGGEQFVFLLRDRFRASSSFRVSSEGPQFKLIVTSMDTTAITVGPSTTYAIVLTAPRLGDGFGYPEGYITSAVYSCPMRSLSQCAESAYGEVGAELELAEKEARDAANEAIERMYLEAAPTR
ncbi:MULTISPECIES: hypothetical protein [Brevundimonas]|uniref:hypothetical protein n=1 Tax=Brevundimonas TaxID=41275 RepID=UPI0015736F6C|nr:MULTISPECIES: hypothetical protein [Brevundimonas]NSX31783.1 hypothetical protein [Brevundimonas vesicularis]